MTARFTGRIRAAGTGDVAAITEIYNQAVRDGTATCDLSDVAPADRARWLERHRHRHGVWVADLDGTVAGWVLLAPYDPKPCFHRTATFSTYVRREQRHRGVGTALRRHMIDEARGRGLHALVNRVWATNEASIALAKQFGFRQVAHLPELVEIGGHYVDCLLFELLLDRLGPIEVPFHGG
ncbi:N-acetyltransferase family protein [Amycolatopsis sp. NPDC005003]